MQQYYYGVPFGDCSGGGGVDNLAVTPLITRHMTNIVVLVAASKSTTEATTLQSGVMVPSCKKGRTGFRACCSEVKVLVGKAPEGCLCDAQVWEELVQKVEDAGIDGLNSNSLNTFANLCGIAHSGGAGCRRLQRRSTRNSRHSSARN